MKKVIALTMVLAMGVMLAPAYGGVVGSWACNEGAGTTVADGTANGNDGTLYGAWAAGRSGAAGDYAVSFNGNDSGVNNYVTVPDDTLNGTLDPGTQFTIEADVYFAGDSTVDSSECLFYKAGVFSVKLYNRCRTGTTYVQFSVNTGTTSDNGWVHLYASGATLDITNDDWCHVKAVYDETLGGGLDTMQLFVDGTRIEPTDMKAQTGTCFNSNDTLDFGRLQASISRLNGRMDNIVFTDVPEPATMTLLLLGLPLALRRRK